MLKKLELEGTGPAPRLALEFQERLNVITGDNGLGKSFLLDVAWWCLTTWWASTQALPRYAAKRAAIRYTVLCGEAAPFEWEIVFDWHSQRWPIVVPGDRLPALVFYARVDGSFSVWDPARPDSTAFPVPREPEPLLFDATSLWAGLGVGDKRPCEGLVRDVVSWQKGREPEFVTFTRALEQLSVPGEKITIGKPRRASVGDGFDTPTLCTPYDPSVPLTHASAGVRRIAGLAYLLVWAWREHRLACELLRRPPVRRAVLLVDEPECHLHPRWQRLIVPALLRTTAALLGADGRTRAGGVSVQIVAATHSPLVLASLEPSFDPQRDRVFTLELNARHEVVAQQPAFRRIGRREPLADERRVRSRCAALQRGRAGPARRRGSAGTTAREPAACAADRRAVALTAGRHGPVLATLALRRRARRLAAGARRSSPAGSAVEAPRGAGNEDAHPPAGAHPLTSPRVIPVAPQPEPDDFDAQVRRPGVRWMRSKGLPQRGKLPAGAELKPYW